MRIAIIAEADPIWCLAIWERAIPSLLRSGHTVGGLAVCPPRFGRLAPERVRSWYRETFGRRAAVALDIYSLAAMSGRAVLSRARQRSAGFPELCARHDLAGIAVETPNGPEFREWLRSMGTDVLILNIGHIVDADTLSIPRTATINLHDSLLPANRGVMPYLWATIRDEPNGLSFHRVVPKIDAGEILYQECVSPQRVRSLTAFQHWVIDRYPQALGKALDALAEGRSVAPASNLTPSYNGIPGAADADAFLAKGGRLVRPGDIAHAVRL